MDFWVRVELCWRYGLRELERDLRSWKPEKGPVKEPVKKPAKEPAKELVKEPAKEPAKGLELLGFIEIADFPSPIMVRRLDFRINVSHITKLSGRLRYTVRDLRKWLGSKKYTIVWGSKKYQGIYIDFDIRIEQYREYGLPKLEKRLYSLRCTSEGPVLEVEPSYTEPRLPVSDVFSVRNKSFKSRGI